MPWVFEDHGNQPACIDQGAVYHDESILLACEEDNSSGFFDGMDWTCLYSRLEGSRITRVKDFLLTREHSIPITRTYNKSESYDTMEEDGDDELENVSLQP